MSHPVDMVYHIQPWMALTLLPLVAVFEGERALASPGLFGFRDPLLVGHYLFMMSLGGVIALSMELAEFLLLQTTSSLTLSISGIGKEIVTLVLDSRINGTRMTTLNILGLCVCLNGIGLHVYHKWQSSSSTHIDDEMEDELTMTKKGLEGGGKKWIELSEIKSWERKKDLLLGERGGHDDCQSGVPLLSTRDSI